MTVDTRYVNILLATHSIPRKRIAVEAGLRRPMVTKILRGYRNISREKQLAVLQTIARLTGCAVEELVMGRLAA